MQITSQCLQPIVSVTDDIVNLAGGNVTVDDPSASRIQLGRESSSVNNPFQLSCRTYKGV
jgi:hypothetical protein